MKLKSDFNKAISLIFFLLVITVLASNLIVGDVLDGKIENNRYFALDTIHKTGSHGERVFIEIKAWVYYFDLSIIYTTFCLLPVFLFVRIKEILLKRKGKNKG